MIGEALHIIRHWIELTLEPADTTAQQAMNLHHQYFLIQKLNQLGFSFAVTYRKGKKGTIRFIKVGAPTMCPYRGVERKSLPQSRMIPMIPKTSKNTGINSNIANKLLRPRKKLSA